MKDVIGVKLDDNTWWPAYISAINNTQIFTITCIGLQTKHKVDISRILPFNIALNKFDEQNNELLKKSIENAIEIKNKLCGDEKESSQSEEMKVDSESIPECFLNLLEAEKIGQVKDVDIKRVYETLRRIISNDIPIENLIRFHIGTILKEFYVIIQESPRLKELEWLTQCAIKELKDIAFEYLFCKKYSTKTQSLIKLITMNDRKYKEITTKNKMKML